jgi:hypothetical protein
MGGLSVSPLSVLSCCPGQSRLSGGVPPGRTGHLGQGDSATPDGARECLRTGPIPKAQLHQNKPATDASESVVALGLVIVPTELIKDFDFNALEKCPYADKCDAALSSKPVPLSV